MELRASLLFACASVCVLGIVHGQVASLCRPNERLLMCGGCQKTCLDPVPDCKGVCRPGCYCEDDQVRNATGHCVKLSECPPLPAYFKLETTEPRPIANCPDNEEYRFCEPCNRTCDNPNPVCPAQCARGCFCRGGLVRNRNGSCVTLDKCENQSVAINEIPHNSAPEKPIAFQPTCGPNQEYSLCSNCEKTCSNQNPRCPAQCSKGCFCKTGLYKAPNGDCVELEKCPKGTPTETPIAYELTCGPNQVFKPCSTCEKTCSNPNPMCPAQCSHGCFCRDGLLKAPSGECVTLDKCPKAAVSFGLSAHESSIEDCSSDEEYFSCGWCEPTCSEPSPVCPPRVCLRGCLCKPPLMRHRSGHCVEKKNCVPQMCPDPAEEFVCRYGCEPRCTQSQCRIRRLRCQLGCHCRLGLLRNDLGRCVPPDRCDN